MPFVQLGIVFSVQTEGVPLSLIQSGIIFICSMIITFGTPLSIVLYILIIRLHLICYTKSDRIKSYIIRYTATNIQSKYS